MKIEKLFKKDINRDIQGVVTIGNEEESRKKQELEEYVLTKELKAHFNTFFSSYNKSINNSTDEAIAGYGNRIEITLNEKENCVSVRDYGRGVPFGIKDGKNVLVAIYTESHTGGKFDKNAYKNSSGLNG